MLYFFLLMVGTSVVFMGVAVVGAVTVRRAKETELKQLGYIVAVVAGALALLIPLWMMFTYPFGEDEREYIETHTEVVR